MKLINKIMSTLLDKLFHLGFIKYWMVNKLDPPVRAVVIGAMLGRDCIINNVTVDLDKNLIFPSDRLIVDVCWQDDPIEVDPDDGYVRKGILMHNSHFITNGKKVGTGRDLATKNMANIYGKVCDY